METPLGFSLSYNILKRFYLKWKACDVLYKIRYILWVAALLGAVTSFKMAAILGAILDFTEKLEIVKKR